MSVLLTRLIGLLVLISALVSLLAVRIGNGLPTEDEIVFSASFANRDAEIYRMSLARGLMAALTHNEDFDLRPVWSPNSDQIAFSSSSDAQNHIYIMNEQGRDMRSLTQSENSEFNPAWSPDGQYITYDRLIYIFSSMLMMTHIQTGTFTFLTDGDSNSTAATWSPNNDVMAFAADPNEIGIQNIYTVDTRNRAMRLLIRSEENTSVPAWSPDGRYLSYISGMPGKQEVLLWDTLLSKSISFGIVADYISAPAAWSPDGRYLLLVLPVDTVTGTAQDTAVFKLDITACLGEEFTICQPQRLTHKQGYYFNADWRPSPP